MNANLNSKRRAARTKSSLRIVATVAVAALIAGAFRLGIPSPGTAHSDRMGRVPHFVLWAWERREDLSFIDPRETAVAYLDRTLELDGATVAIRPRLEPLTVPPRTVLIPVARIEINRRSRPSLSVAQRSEAARIIAAMAASSPAAIQIDFDATLSQRAFYRDLLAEVHGRLPASTALSITALASWCMDDDWVARLPVDEIVPMLYRMGPDAEDIRSYLRGGGDFVPPLARISVGLSTDEHLAGLADGKRAYLFSAQAWTLEEAHQAIAEATK